MKMGIVSNQETRYQESKDRKKRGFYLERGMGNLTKFAEDGKLIHNGVRYIKEKNFVSSKNRS